MPDKVWKAVERKLARRFGTTRVGARDDVQMDIDAGWLSIEVKHRKKIAKFLKDAVAQAVRNAGVSQLPIVILHESGQRHDNDIVMVRLKDFQEWFVSDPDIQKWKAVAHLCENDKPRMDGLLRELALREARASVALDHDERIQTQYEE